MNKNQHEYSLERRDFIKLALMGGSAAMLPKPVFAGPFDYSTMAHLVPVDKKLSREWLKSLTERGAQEVYTAKAGELKHIGMPVGGIACGQLYLAGDGTLWLWRIFKTEYNREKLKPEEREPSALAPPKKGARIPTIAPETHYIFPEKAVNREIRPVDQGTVIKVISNGKESSLTLDKDGYDNIEFRGEYPIGKVAYRDAALPVQVSLEAFSPYIPLNAGESSLPLTIMSYNITNSSNKKVKVEIAKWLENVACPYVEDPAWGNRVNRLEVDGGRISIVGGIEDGDARNSKGEKLSEQHGYGTMALSLLNREGNEKVALSLSTNGITQELANSLVDVDQSSLESTAPFGDKLAGAISTGFELNPGESKSVDFCISWFFPYIQQQNVEKGWLLGLTGLKDLKKHYFNRFDSAGGVAAYLQANFDQLVGTTRNWNKVWYDSSLPYWFLDRSFIPNDCMATNTVLQFSNGRWWGWEGVHCCPGTCKHVWHYAQGMARVFPEVERYLRQEVDYKISMNPDGGLWHRDETRGEYGKVVAQDGHCGTILRAYREHRMSADEYFLKTNYSSIKKTVQYIIHEDKDCDGILEGEQHNTLDASWFGPMGWISSLYIASLAAGREMAVEMGDTTFAEKCDALLKKGRKKIVKELYNGEYFIHKPDPNHPEALNTNDGCHIDQVFGQSWAFQAGIPDRIIPEAECKSALESIWKYNYAPDAFAYQEQHKYINNPRIYAASGEAGVIMCTWPRGGADNVIPTVPDTTPRNEIQFGRYFDECMNGFEHQVASHMISEGMVEKGLAIVKSIHERYGAQKRNPYNEIECGDHYSRSMASYGSYIAACGFDYHGPKGILCFNPRINPEDFKAAFITAEGWGSFSQAVKESKFAASLELTYGKLALNELVVHALPGTETHQAQVLLGGRAVASEFSEDGDRLRVRFTKTLRLVAGQKLDIHYS